MNALSSLDQIDLYQPNDLKSAFSLLDHFGIDAWKLAGGHDSLTWFKAGLKKPKAVIDLSAIPGLTTIKETPDGVEIGALASLAAVAGHPLIQTRYRLLAEAAGQVAVPEIRNTGTIGGNVTQRPRCCFYRGGLPCWRNQGKGCFAQSEANVSQGHAIFDRGDCAAVTPSDTAPTLAVLNAQFVLESGDGQRVLGPDEFFIGWNANAGNLNAIRPGEILVAIRLPHEWASSCFYFEKLADHLEWDFPLVNVAAALKVDQDGRIEGARIACGAVSAVPKRFIEAEQAIKGRIADQDSGQLAGVIAIKNASPLGDDRYKVPLIADLVMRAVRDAKS